MGCGAQECADDAQLGGLGGDVDVGGVGETADGAQSAEAGLVGDRDEAVRCGADGDQEQAAVEQLRWEVAADEVLVGLGLRCGVVGGGDEVNRPGVSGD